MSTELIYSTDSCFIQSVMVFALCSQDARGCQQSSVYHVLVTQRLDNLGLKYSDKWLSSTLLMASVTSFAWVNAIFMSIILPLMGPRVGIQKTKPLQVTKVRIEQIRKYHKSNLLHR